MLGRLHDADDLALPAYREMSGKLAIIGPLPAGHAVEPQVIAADRDRLPRRELGDPNPDGSLAVRLYYKPLVLLIWLGAVVMVIGGALSLSDRRLRVGAPKPARSKAALVPAE